MDGSGGSLLISGVFVVKPYAETFYKSQQWKDCREAYAKSVSGLCERCLKKGNYSPGEIVHHKKHLTPNNITDPNITLSFDNLELLCRACHAEEHQRTKRRYKICEDGRVMIDPPQKIF